MISDGWLDGADDDAQDWIVRHAERRHAHQAELMTAQDDRVAVVLATTVSLAALAALAAAIALAVPRDATSVLVASLIALAGFSGASALILTAVRSRQFKTPGGQPSELRASCTGPLTLQALRAAWLVELDECLKQNAMLLEERRHIANWALWTLSTTPVFALLCGWLAAKS